MKISQTASVSLFLIVIIGSACIERASRNVSTGELKSNSHIAAATPNSVPEWELVKKDEDGVEIYYSPKRINRKDNLSSVWIRVLNGKAKGSKNDPKDLIFLKEFTCSNKTSRVLSIAAYNEKGKHVDYPIDKRAGRITYVLPQSIEESIMKTACKE
jgi:hypothetical protein